MATFCTTNPNGTIQAVPVWYRYDGDAFWVMSGTDMRKTKNLRLDPRVSLSIVHTKTETEPTRIALVYGKATIHDWTLDDVKAKGAWIFSKYVDEEGVRQRIDPHPGGRCLHPRDQGREAPLLASLAPAPALGRRAW